MDSHKKIYVRFHTQTKDSQKESSKHKTVFFLKQKYTQGREREVPRGGTSTRLFWDWIFAAAFWAGKSCDVQWGGL